LAGSLAFVDEQRRTGRSAGNRVVAAFSERVAGIALDAAFELKQVWAARRPQLHRAHNIK
jgi:hypothetical protein